MRLVIALVIASCYSLCAAQQPPGIEPQTMGVPSIDDMPAVGGASSLLDSLGTGGLGELGPTTPRVPAVPTQPPTTAPPTGGASRYALPRAASPAAVPTSSSASSPPQSNAQVRYAESLIEAALTKPANSQLSGVGISMSQVVAATGSRSSQSANIAAYWDLCSTVADYYLSLYEQSELERLARSSSAGAPLRAALAKMNTRRDTAFAAARATQLRLASLIQRNDQSPLPLPKDLPLVGAYETYYTQTFSVGGPREAAELNRLLPLRHAELLSAASAVADAEDWYKTVAARPASDQGEGVVKALQLLALNRRAFVQITRDYNKRISRYTELARPGNLRTERLVSMLVKTNRLASRSSTPATPRTDRRSEVSPQPTFREEWRDPNQQLNPRMDRDVLPAGAIGDPNTELPGSADRNMVERVEPGEVSVLVGESPPE